MKISMWGITLMTVQRRRGSTLDTRLTRTVRRWGQTFTKPAVVPGSRDPAGGLNGSHQGLLMRKLALHEAGTIAIVNSSMKYGERSRVWLMRGHVQERQQEE
ncbi:MAG TPA: hypothetical protein PKJ77_03520 [Thermodesulfobacteriota bacterium]|nr:hypothetical protein [Deltaproteobacteria bacterium]HOC38325.1 hypothetical protein [Thermodesulfobacteriota bacterium]